MARLAALTAHSTPAGMMIYQSAPMALLSLCFPLTVHRAKAVLPLAA